MTIKDIARMAGVSYSTVSRCLNDSPLVSDITKANVLKIADEVGFEFNASAQSLVTKRAGTIGIMLPANFDRFYVNLYHSSLMNHLRTVLEKEGFDLIVGFPLNQFTGQNNIRKLVTRKKVDGLILMQPSLDKGTLLFLEDHNIPHIFIHYPPEFSKKGMVAVYSDNYEGGCLVGRHLMDIGRRSLVIMSSDTEDYEFDLRRRGLIETIGDYCSEIVNISCKDFSFESGYEALMQHRGIIREKDALFAMDDLLALGALKACRELKIEVPGQLAVIGYDDTPLSRYSDPALTTVRQPEEEIASLSCQKIIAMIRGENQSNVEGLLSALPPGLIVRSSSLN